MMLLWPLHPHTRTEFKAVFPLPTSAKGTVKISAKEAVTIFIFATDWPKLPPISQDNNRENHRSDDDAGHTKQERLFAAILTNLGRPPRHSGHEEKANAGQPPNRTSLTFWFFLSTIGANKHGGNRRVASGEASATSETWFAKKPTD
ncbi:MAG TPA: hypothetical protein VNN22_19650 [Verrucomicrobiae bacterium]|nr:hypothetical protein [Verrucomicrobiae bacterium]